MAELGPGPDLSNGRHAEVTRARSRRILTIWLGGQSSVAASCRLGLQVCSPSAMSGWPRIFMDARNSAVASLSTHAVDRERLRHPCNLVRLRACLLCIRGNSPRTVDSALRRDRDICAHAPWRSSRWGSKGRPWRCRPVSPLQLVAAMFFARRAVLEKRSTRRCRHCHVRHSNTLKYVPGRINR